MSRQNNDDSDNECEDVEWLLGFVDPPQKPTDLLRHRFPSKVGGRPSWLDPLHLPSTSQLTCPATNEPMRFLMQVYAPIDGNPHSFHRCIFIFISPDGSTLASTPHSVRALRCQLPRINNFYLPKPAEESVTTPPPLTKEEEENSLSRDPWKVLEFEKKVGISEDATIVPCRPVLFPEIELVVEPEEEDNLMDATSSAPSSSSNNTPHRVVDAKTQALIDHYNHRNATEGEYTESELPSDMIDSLEANATEDQQHFATFAARIARDPGQVLRYCFDQNALPLCPSPHGIPKKEDVPCCPCCGGPRQFEFQVMPQLLNHLGVDAEDVRGPDWGTIAVYSCKKSCCDDAGGNRYIDEYVWVQKSA